jgi:ATP-binding cassette subfamily F protein 3
VLLDALTRFAGTVIFVSHDRHFISHLATSVLEVKGGGATYLPGDYDYYLGRLARDAAAAEGTAARRAADAPTVSVVQRERQEQKRMKGELRSLEKEEAQLMQGLIDLEAERKRIEESMASPEVYASGDRMRGLVKEHEANQQAHARSMEEWERVDTKLRELRESLGPAE